MNKGFWSKLNKPIFVLAPMANVTDAAFRRMIAKYGKPDVFWTEFVSVDGLLSEGKQSILTDLWYTEEERPIVAQIFGSKPENFFKVAELVKELGFDGIDINMGCPDRNVEKQGAGSCMMKNPQLAQEVVLATKEGAGGLPVSVKTRIGYSRNQIETWLPDLVESGPAVITVHARTRNEMSLVPARWEVIKQAVEILDGLNLGDNRPLLFGNGDVMNLSQAEERVKETGADGVMIGRGIFGNPWLFNKDVERDDLPVSERIKVMIEHTYLFEELFAGNPSAGSGSLKNFDIMKKHFKAYMNGFEGAKEMRVKMMETKSAAEVEQAARDMGLI